MAKSTVSVEPAGFWVRFAALVVDSFIFLVSLMATGVVSAIVFTAAPHSHSPVALLIILLVFLGIPCLYFTLMTASKGQTLGKMLFNLKVVQTDGSPLSLGRSFFRWLAYLLSTVPMGLGYLFPAFQKDKRALHDLFCGTQVVQSGPTNQVALILVLVLIPFMAVPMTGILAAIAIPRFAQMLEKSREGATKGNMGALKSAAAIYYGDHQGKWPADLEKDLVPTYIAAIPPVKATGAFVANAKSPVGNNVTMAQPGEVPTQSGSGWLYDRSNGNIFVNSTVQDSHGIPYSFYGFE